MIVESCFLFVNKVVSSGAAKVAPLFYAVKTFFIVFSSETKPELMILQTFFRGLARNKSLAAINITGLALGFASCILIFLFLNDELSYDSYNKNLNRIYRINTRFSTGGTEDHIAISGAQFPDAMKEFPEVEACVRFNTQGSNLHVKYGDRVFPEANVYKADRNVFEIFSYDMIKGNPKMALNSPRNIVLTESIAKKYFGGDDPIGKILLVDKEERQVTAVIRDIPLNSDLYFTMLMGEDSVRNKADLFDFSYYTYVLFQKKSMEDPEMPGNFLKKLQKFTDETINAKIREESLDMSVTVGLQPLQGLHFQKPLEYDTPKGNQNYVYIFVSVAILILFIACINYINFSIVQSMEKSREVGIRKAIGSSFKQLVTRYLAQSLLLTFIALCLSLVLVALLLPAFNDIVSRNFSIGDVFVPEIFGAIVLSMLTTGILAGSYPAFYSASMKIVNALKGQVSSPAGKSIRKISITIQFALTLGLLVSTVIIYSQMSFLKNYDLGFKRENMIALHTPQDSAHFNSIKALKEEISNQPFVHSAALAGWGGLPGDSEDEQRGSLTLKNEGKDEIRMVNNSYIDEDYLNTLQVEFSEGRNYEKGSVNDLKNSIIVNEALVQMMRWKDPLAQKIKWGGTERNIIGVVKNIHYRPLYNPVQAQIFVPHQNQIGSIIIGIKPGAEVDVELLRKLWNKFLPDDPFDVRYIDEGLNKQYSQEQTVAKILTYFSVLTILISTLGLFGLSLLSIYQRRKEVGIRKIIGADFRDIALLFSKEYFLLIIISLAIISPLSWYVMSEWLTTFVSHISIDIVIYIVVGVFFTVVALASVMLSIQKVASGKSVDLLR